MPELETKEVRSRRTGGRHRSGCPVLSLDILTLRKVHRGLCECVTMSPVSACLLGASSLSTDNTRGVPRSVRRWRGPSLGTSWAQIRRL